MSARVVDLLINTARTPGAVLLARVADQLPADYPQLVQGEAVTVRVQFIAPATTPGAAPTVVALAVGDNLLLTLKAKPGADALLASASAWVATGAGAELRYEATLNLHTAEAADAVAEEPAIAAVAELQVQNAANTLRKSYPFGVTLRRAVFEAEGDPVAANPAYPAPDAVALRVPANGTYRIKTTGDGQHFQLKNATTGLWHTAFLTGAEGAVTLAFGAGEA